MKAFAIVLLCALAAVQGRYTALQSSEAALGENPWLVHLRIAVSYSGLLNTGAGSLIGNRWVLTTAKNIFNSRFIWIRYGAVNVINPSLMTETSSVRIHPLYNATTGENNIALININRDVHTTEYIAPISPLGLPEESARFCSYGVNGDAPGEVLRCYDVSLEVDKDDSITLKSDEIQPSVFDNGTPLVKNGVQVGLLDDAASGKILRTADYQEWLQEETGLDWSSDEAPEAVRFIQ